MNLVMITDSGGGSSEAVALLDTGVVVGSFGASPRSLTLPVSVGEGNCIAVCVDPPGQVTSVTDNETNTYSSRGDGIYVCTSVTGTPTTLSLTGDGSFTPRAAVAVFDGVDSIGTDATGTSGFAASHTINYTPPSAGCGVFLFISSLSGGLTSFTPNDANHSWEQLYTAVQVAARAVADADETSVSFEWNSSAGVNAYRIVFLVPA